NRIALQSDMIGANILGIENILFLSGDHTNTSENSKAKPVYDLDSAGMIKTARLLETGFDLAGKKLQGVPSFCAGAVVNPSARPIDLQIVMYGKKITAGAEFFQTQTVFDIQTYRDFYEKIKHFKIKTLAGITLIKSPQFMSFLQKLPGVQIPKEIQNRINSAEDPLKEGIKICAQLIRDLQTFADGVHIMAIGMEEYIPEILKDLD
ncbi:MAG: methylenetetrahydrofolate reductase, partial [Elusimicrobiota bacterium]|nr:methylenetetrahydrofolate reductase [Elusimicrobiota bacterium]